MEPEDKKVYDSIEKLEKQYQLFMGNEFIKYYLLDARIPKNDWIDIEDLINSNKYYKTKGYELNKLYEQISTFISFLKKIEDEIIPRMKAESTGRMIKMSHDSKILFKLTLDNMSVNLNIFYDIIRELLANLKEIDKRINGEKNMLYQKLSYLKDIQEEVNR